MTWGKIPSQSSSLSFSKSTSGKYVEECIDEVLMTESSTLLLEVSVCLKLNYCMISKNSSHVFATACNELACALWVKINWWSWMSSISIVLWHVLISHYSMASLSIVLGKLKDNHHFTWYRHLILTISKTICFKTHWHTQRRSNFVHMIHISENLFLAFVGL